MRSFLKDAGDSMYSEEQFKQLQSIIIEDADVLASAMDLIMSSEVSYSEKHTLVELVSACSEDVTTDFAMELTKCTTADVQALGVELAINLMRNGNTADMLVQISNNPCADEYRDIAKKAFHEISNINMEEQDKNRVAELLSDYVKKGESSLKPVALQSLGALVADDKCKVVSLFNEYCTKDYDDEVRLSAVKILTDLKVDRLDSEVELKLTEITNNKDEPDELRSMAMQVINIFREC
jgi:hypothetical protein